MDWVAIGSIATVATALVAFLQLRKPAHSVPAGTTTLAGAPEALPAKLREPPARVDYQLKTVGGSLPPKIIDAILKPLTIDVGETLDDYMIGRDALRSLSATTLEFVNNADHAIQDIRLRLKIPGRLFSLRVENVSKLPKESVQISVEGASIRIWLEEMPEGETVTLGIFHDGGNYGGELKSERANIELRDQSYAELLRKRD